MACFLGFELGESGSLLRCKDLGISLRTTATWIGVNLLPIRRLSLHQDGSWDRYDL